MENDEQIGSLKRNEQKKWHARTVGLVGRCAQWSRHGAVQLRRDKSEMQFYLAQHTRFTRLGTRVRRRVTAFDMARSVLCVHLLYRKSLRDVLLPSALRKRKPTTARRRGAAPCPAAARCVHGNWNSYTVAAQPMGSSCKPFPLPGPAALGGVFTSPDRPTDRPTHRRRSGPRGAGGWRPCHFRSRATLGGWGVLCTWALGHHSRCGPFLRTRAYIIGAAAHRPVLGRPRAPWQPQRARMCWRCKPSAEVPTDRPGCRTNQPNTTVSAAGPRGAAPPRVKCAGRYRAVVSCASHCAKRAHRGRPVMCGRNVAHVIIEGNGTSTFHAIATCTKQH